MFSFKKIILFVFLTLNLNVAFATLTPQEIAAACGESSCEILFKKMQKFAKNGSPHAQVVLALFYRGGYGTEIDNEQSLKYMKRAAKNRLSFAQYDLGILYKLGHTVKKDDVKSESWLMRSANLGYKPAIKLLTSENKISKKENEILWPANEEGVERITITREKHTLSDLVDYLSTMGYGRKSNTGSRIRGKGCGSSGTSCATMKYNTPIGSTHFSNLMSTINTGQTGRIMAAMIK
ncbi:MAG: sel1 repeat family protein [Paraglaciecola sp.]|nr:sel1 repeat family protein [Paraglaciecola sp.]